MRDAIPWNDSQQGILAGLDLGGGTQGNTWNQSSPITAGNSDMGDLLDMSSPLDFSTGCALLGPFLTC